jgi:hypothetical protein
MVTFLRSGLAVPWDSRFGSLLELAEACAIPCSGPADRAYATSARVALIEGEFAYAPEPLASPAEGSALICCCMPKTAVGLDL